MVYSYGYRYSRTGGGFLPSDLNGLQFWGAPYDTEYVNSLLAADFVSTNSEFLSSSSTDFDKGNEDFSFGCWVKFDAAAIGSSVAVVGKYDIGQRSYILLKEGGTDRLRFYLSNNGTAVNGPLDGTVMTSGVWYFVAGVYDSVNDLIKVSVNGGNFITTSDANGAYAASTADLWFARFNSIYTDCQIDAPFFYNKALTLAELKSLYNAGSGVDYTNLTDLNGTEFAIGQNFVAASTQSFSTTSTDFDKADSDFSWGGWVKIDSTGSGMAFFGKWGNSSNTKSYQLYKTSADALRLLMSSDGTTNNVSLDTITMSAGTWYFVVGVYDSVNDLAKLSVNGSSFYTAALAGGVNSAPYRFELGRLELVGNDLDGQLDGGFFYDKALSLVEIQALYNSGNGVAYTDLSAAQKTSLVSWWELNDVEGVNQTDSHGTNDLTPSNTPTSIAGKVNDTTISNIDTSLVSWWTLNEASGTRYDAHGTNDLTDNNTVGTATGKIQEDVINAGDSVYTVIDQSGASNNAVQTTVTAQPEWVAGKAMDFNGTTDALNIDTLQTALKPDTVGYIGGWIKPNDISSSQYIASFANSTSGVFICGFQQLATGIVRFLLRKAGSVVAIDLRTDSAVLANGVWCHIMIVQNSTNSTIYINGVAVAQTDTGLAKGDWHAVFGNNLNNGRLGCLNYNGGGDQFHFDGQLGEWVAGSSVIPASDVLNLYNSQATLYS